MLASESPIADIKNKKKKIAEIERLVLSIAEFLYKTKPQIKCYGESSIGVWELKFADDRGDRVLKIGLESPNALLREQSIAKKLYELGLAVPEIEFTQQDMPNAWLPFMVMSKVTETSLKEASLDDLPCAIEGCYKAGEFLARLCQIPLSAIDLQPPLAFMPGNLEKEASSVPFDLQKWQKVINNLKQWEVLSPEIRAILMRVKEIIERRDYSNIIHRDFIPRQILVSSQAFAVIDWESATIGRTFVDLGDFLGSIRRSLRKKENRLDYVRNFLAGFTSLQSLSDAEKSEIALWEAYSHIRAAVEQGQRNKRDKTIRRLRFATEAIEPDPT